MPAMLLATILPSATMAFNTVGASDFTVMAQSTTQLAGVPGETTDKPRGAKWSESLLWIAIVLLTLVVAVGAIVIFSRRFKDYLLVGERRSTSATDVWRMHRLPPEPDAEEERGNTIDD